VVIVVAAEQSRKETALAKAAAVTVVVVVVVETIVAVASEYCSANTRHCMIVPAVVVVIRDTKHITLTLWVKKMNY